MRRVLLFYSVIAVGCLGCTLEDVVEHGAKCPADNPSAQLSYIKIGNTICKRDVAEDESAEAKCFQQEIQEAFKNNVCPAKQKDCLVDAQGQFFCEGDCSSGLIRCGSTCIDPMNSNDYCGASLQGNCTSDDPEDLNYKGEICDSGNVCSMGHCKPVLDTICVGTQVKCGEQCRDPMTDNMYCGAKGTVLTCESEGTKCSETQVCFEGECIQNDCSGDTPNLCVVEGQKTCQNINGSDSFHCGACGYKCSEHAIPNASSSVCAAGVCQYECNAGYINVSSEHSASEIKCIDPLSDKDHCGASGPDAPGEACAEGQVCIEGSCMQNNCSGDTPDLCMVDGSTACLNLHSDDVMHCGACNYNCSEHATQNATSQSCEEGVCIYVCATGFVNVSTESSVGSIKCIDPMTDNTYCGAADSENLGEICKGGTVCVGGSCVQNTCSGDTPNLCVVHGANVCKNTNSDDADHCGACNYKCSEHAIPNANSESCSDGACIYTCATGFVNVSAGTSANTIKCIDPMTDNNYCGASDATTPGTVCTGGTVCVEGQCLQNDCAENAEAPNLCVIDGQNSCKNIKSNDADHCGACNYKCSDHPIPNANSTSCSGGACVYECAAGFVNVSTGTTTNTIRCIDPKTDNKFCGAESNSNQGTMCTGGKVCVEGSCVTNSCTGDTPNLCVVNGRNECKNINSNDSDHCGACNYKCSEHAIPNATSSSCASGACQYTCDPGYVNVSTGSTANTIKCIDPKTDNTFCGAESASNLGTKCTGGTVCVESKCVPNSCSGDKPNLCVINGNNVCKNVNSNDADHCGACNYKCSEHAIPNATSSSCVGGACVYTCDPGFVNVSTGSTANTIKCIDPKSDNNYCGASSSSTGTPCTGGKVCVDSTCMTNSCSGDKPNLCVINGKNDCKNVKANDADHCGTCNYKCSEHAIQNATSSTCSGGNCQYTCSTGYVNVSSGSTANTIKCIDPSTDNTYCGAKSASSLGTSCTGGKVCVNSNCVQNQCSSGETLCQISGTNTCVDIKGSKTEHCGACNYNCKDHPIQNATSDSCSAGECIYKCNSGYVNVGSASTANKIKCIDPKTDNNYCGATDSSEGKPCTGGTVCVSGECVQNKCSNSAETLCQVNGTNTCIKVNSSDASHCGACNYKCSEHAIPNATSNSCSSGNCQYTCNTGYVNVSSGKTSQTIKCIDPKTDNTYCGATSSSSTGKKCDTGTVCVNGACTTNSCSGTTPDLCVVNGKNQCKNISGSDADHCGACNYKCSEHVPANAKIKGSGSGTCLTGKCQYECQSGYINKTGGTTADTILCVSSTVECPSNQKNCNGYCLTTSLLSSTFHVTVSSSSCTCTSGYINSNDDWSDGCESKVNVTPKCLLEEYDCNNDGSKCCLCKAACAGLGLNCNNKLCLTADECPLIELPYACSTKNGTQCCECAAQCSNGRCNLSVECPQIID